MTYALQFMTSSVDQLASPESDTVNPPLGQTFKERDGESQPALS